MFCLICQRLGSATVVGSPDQVPPQPELFEEKLAAVGQLERGEIISALESMKLATLRRWTSVARAPAVIEHIKSVLEGGVDKLVMFALHRQVIGTIDRWMLGFGGNIFRRGPITNVTLRKASERHDPDRRAEGTCICQRCEELNAAAAVVCSCCGARLGSVRDEKLDPIKVIGDDRCNWLRVLGIHGRVHASWVSDFLPLQHPSLGARRHAGNKWRQLSSSQQLPPPVSADEAEVRFRSGELRQPARALVERDSEWWPIKAAEFGA
jgi:hypothetical protein